MAALPEEAALGLLPPSDATSEANDCRCSRKAAGQVQIQLKTLGIIWLAQIGSATGKPAATSNATSDATSDAPPDATSVAV